MHLKREGLGVVSIGRGPNGEDGVTSFAELQAVLSDGPASRLVYYAFDLLHLDGRDVMPLPLVQRKEALESLLARLQKGSPGPLLRARC